MSLRIEGAKFFAACRPRDEFSELAIAQVHPTVGNWRKPNLRGRTLHREPPTGKLAWDDQPEFMSTPAVDITARLSAPVGIHPTLDRSRMNLPCFP